jgi:hypothetical protein
MGTDRVRLFDKAVADRVLAMEREELEAFVSEKLNTLRTNATYASELFYLMDKEQLPVQDAIERLVSEGFRGTSPAQALAALRANLALDAALGSEEIAVDYWGCYTEVLLSANGMLSCVDYMGMEEEIFLLLAPEHVDLMLASLDAHVSELSIMRPEHVARLRRWRSECAANPNFRVAYFLDC